MGENNFFINSNTLELGEGGGINSCSLVYGVDPDSQRVNNKGILRVWREMYFRISKGYTIYIYFHNTKIIIDINITSS